MAALYLIEILHQTTTMATATPLLLCCILSKFYIKPQRRKRYYVRRLCCILSKFYIKPQRTGNRPREAAGCILSKFYIKPQRLRLRYRRVFCCILSKFYIKPQQSFKCFIAERRCILSKFYIKPQLFAILIFLIFSCILSKFYIKPQPCSERDFIRTVVSYRNSTSNHNSIDRWSNADSLYLIEILHQTTTVGPHID